MPQATTQQGVTLEYETVGSPADPPLLLVMGFGAQLIAWPRAFCERLAAGGRFVISFDNRDCGLSSKLDGRGAELTSVIAAASAGDFEQARALAAYTLSDMSDDGLALLSALGIERAHVLGSSMGGIIAQTMAIEHPERLLTLTSMMSTTGEREFGQSTPQATQALLTPAPADRSGYVDAAESSLIWRSKKHPDLAGVRELAGESFDRCYCPAGVTRQLAAMIASGSRAEGLQRLQYATLVIHGLDDTLVAEWQVERTAALIPDARLLLVGDMGHDRPEALWPQICDAILEHTESPGRFRAPAQVRGEDGRGGFEPPKRGLPACWFSSPVHSTALPPFRARLVGRLVDLPAAGGRARRRLHERFAQRPADLGQASRAPRPIAEGWVKLWIYPG